MLADNLYISIGDLDPDGLDAHELVEEFCNAIRDDDCDDARDFALDAEGSVELQIYN